ALRHSPDRVTTLVRHAGHASKLARREPRRSANPSPAQHRTKFPKSRRRHARNCAYFPGRAGKDRTLRDCRAASREPAAIRLHAGGELPDEGSSRTGGPGPRTDREIVRRAWTTKAQ